MARQQRSLYPVLGVEFRKRPISPREGIWLLPKLEYFTMANDLGMTAERGSQQSRPGSLRSGDDKLDWFGLRKGKYQLASTHAHGYAEVFGKLSSFNARRVLQLDTLATKSSHGSEVLITRGKHQVHRVGKLVHVSSRH